MFDLDDTLYPERAYVSSGFGAVAAWAEQHTGIPAARGKRELEALFDAGIKTRTFDHWFEQCGISDTAYTCQAVSLYRGHVPQIEPFPEMVDLLVRLRAAHHLGIVSDGTAEIQRKKLDALGLANLFEVIVFSDELGRDAWKPSPLPFQHALTRLGLEPADAVYVGDNPRKDFLGARRAGLESIWLQLPGGVYADLFPESSEYDADIRVNSMRALEQLLLQEL